MRPPLGTGTQRAPDERPALLSAPHSIHPSQKQINVSFIFFLPSVRAPLPVHLHRCIHHLSLAPPILYLLFSPTSPERKSCKIIIFLPKWEALMGLSTTDAKKKPSHSSDTHGYGNIRRHTDAKRPLPRIFLTLRGILIEPWGSCLSHPPGVKLGEKSLGNTGKKLLRLLTHAASSMEDALWMGTSPVFYRQAHTAARRGNYFCSAASFYLNYRVFSAQNPTFRYSSSGIPAKLPGNSTNKKSSPLHVAIKNENRWVPAAPASSARCS